MREYESIEAWGGIEGGFGGIQPEQRIGGGSTDIGGDGDFLMLKAEG